RSSTTNPESRASPRSGCSWPPASSGRVSYRPSVLAVLLTRDRVADHHHRAGGVMDGMLADRSQQRLSESAVPAAADNQEVSAGGRIQQHPGSVPLGHLVPDLQRLLAGGDLGDGTGDDLSGEFLPVDVRYRDRVAGNG